MRMKVKQTTRSEIYSGQSWIQRHYAYITTTAIELFEGLGKLRLAISQSQQLIHIFCVAKSSCTISDQNKMYLVFKTTEKEENTTNYINQPHARYSMIIPQSQIKN